MTVRYALDPFDQAITNLCRAGFTFTEVPILRRDPPPDAPGSPLCRCGRNAVAGTNPPVCRYHRERGKQ